MAINMPTLAPQAQEESTLDKIAQGLNIINSTLGIALAVPKYMQDRKASNQQMELGRQQAELNKSQLEVSKANAAKGKAETIATIGKNYRPIQGPEAGDIDLGYEYGGRMVLRNQPQELGDFDKEVFKAYSQDFQPSPQKKDGSIVVNIGGKETFWEPKASQAADRSFSQEQQLRKEFLSQSSPFIAQAEGYGRVLSGFKEKTGPGDIAGIYGYIKLLDPGSAVREGEIALAGQAKSIPDWALGWYNKAVDGQILPPEVRQRFMNSAQGLYKTAKKFQDVREENYRTIAKENDINPTRIIGNLGDSIISTIEKTISGVDNISADDIRAELDKRKRGKSGG